MTDFEIAKIVTEKQAEGYRALRIKLNALRKHDASSEIKDLLFFLDFQDGKIKDFIDSNLEDEG